MRYYLLASFVKVAIIVVVVLAVAAGVAARLHQKGGDRRSDTRLVD